MTPAQMIDRLDAALAAAGTPAALTRTLNGVTATASVRVKPTVAPGVEIVGGIQTPGAVLIVSPSDLVASAATWPGTLAATDGLDPILPRKNDKITVAGEGRQRSVESALPIYVAGVLVRINITTK